MIFLITKFYINLVSLITKFIKIQGIARFTNCCPGRWGGRGCCRLMCAPVVVVEDVGGALEVGDGACDFEDAVVGASVHVHAFHGVAKLFQAGGVGLGVFVQQGGGHLGVAVDAGLVLKSPLLEHPGGDDTLADGGAGLSWSLG